MHKFKPQSCVSNFCNKSNLSMPCFAAFHSVWVHLGPFRYCMKLGAKWAELVQIMKKFVPRSSVRCFHNERTQSTPLDPKCMYWCVLSVWVHFGWFHYCMKLGAKRAELEQLMQKFGPRSRIRIFGSERTRSTPLDPKLMIWCVS